MRNIHVFLVGAISNGLVLAKSFEEVRKLHRELLGVVILRTKGSKTVKKEEEDLKELMRKLPPSDLSCSRREMFSKPAH